MPISQLDGTFTYAAWMQTMIAEKLQTDTSSQWRSQPKNLGGAKMCDFRRITLLCLENRLSKHRTTIFFKNVGGHGPSDPAGYAYASSALLAADFTLKK